MAKKELLTKKEELALKEQGGNIDPLLKPLRKEILLFYGNLAGIYKLLDKSALLDLKVGDPLEFRYSLSKYEKAAVWVYSSKGQVGYVSESDEVIFKRSLDAGKSLIGKVRKTDFSHGFPAIVFSINLEDF